MKIIGPPSPVAPAFLMNGWECAHVDTPCAAALSVMIYNITWSDILFTNKEVMIEIAFYFQYIILWNVAIWK